jgi:hypothetical protein
VKIYRIAQSFHVCSQFSSAGTPFANVAPPAHRNDPLVTLVPRLEQPGAACDRPIGSWDQLGDEGIVLVNAGAGFDE